MKKVTKLRLIGGAILMFNLWLTGYYNIEGIPLLVFTFGFAAWYESLVVRSASTTTEKSE